MTGTGHRPVEPRWVGQFRSELVRGHHVILHGNIHDLVLWGGRCQDARQVVADHLRSALYRIIGSYDPVDGLTFAAPDMAEWFEALMHPDGPPQSPAASQPPASQVPVAPPPAADDRPPAETERLRRVHAAQASMRQAVATAPTPTLRDPHAALAAIRHAMAQESVPVAFVLDLTETFVQGPLHVDPNDRQLLALLKRLMLEARLAGRSGPSRMRNLVVILASELSQVPAWLYQKEPLVRVIEVDLPSFDERVDFVSRGIGEFHGSQDLSPARRTEVAEVIANLTQGAPLHDLEALKRTSVFERMSVAEPRDLVTLHKFGRRDDPWNRVAGRLSQARQLLSQRVIGQPAAVDAVVEMVAAASVGIDFVADPHSVEARPKGVFLFVGPTGVGKTELARALSVFLFDSENALARFDMSSYSESHAAERLAGSPPGYVGHERGGELTNRVLAQPFSILLFDEIEKAHGSVWDKFLQVLEDGRLTDGLGRTAYFSQTVIIFTSNIGASDIYGRVHAGQALPPYEEVAMSFRRAVETYFTRKLARPELLGRLGDGIVAFDLLRPESVGPICRKFLGQLVSESRRRLKLEVVIDDISVVDHVQQRMAEGHLLALGARRIRPLLTSAVRAPLVGWITANNPPPGTRVRLHIPVGGDSAVVEGE